MTISPQTNAVKPPVNRLDDESTVPDITASFTHCIDETHYWLYEIRLCVTLFCRCSRREFGFDFGMN
jgi:hypothetical protein